MLRIKSLGALLASAQQTAATNTNVVAAPLVKFSGVLTDVNGKPLTGTVGVTFLLCKDEQGGAPLWLEVGPLVAGSLQSVRTICPSGT